MLMTAMTFVCGFIFRLHNLQTRDELKHSNSSSKLSNKSFPTCNFSKTTFLHSHVLQVMLVSPGFDTNRYFLHCFCFADYLLRGLRDQGQGLFWPDISFLVALTVQEQINKLNKCLRKIFFVGHFFWLFYIPSRLCHDVYYEVCLFKGSCLCFVQINVAVYLKVDSSNTH